MLTTLLAIVLTVSPSQASNKITDAQKKEFIEILRTLPVKGEFFTDEAVKRAEPYLPVLLSLTEKDIEGYDIYPFLALSRGLADHKEHRDYAVSHFAEIRHPILKLAWAGMLFDAKSTSPQIIQFLRDALKSKEQSKVLSEMLGPDFNNFQMRVKAYRPRN